MRFNASISCSLNKGSYEPGDVLRGYLMVHNEGSDIRVDVFVGIQRPDGSIATLRSDGNLRLGVWPWLSDVMIPAGAVLGPAMVLELSITDSAPKGQYAYVAALRPSDGPDDHFPAVDSVLFSIPFGTGTRTP